jgi:hypothetical protein
MLAISPMKAEAIKSCVPATMTSFFSIYMKSVQDIEVSTKAKGPVKGLGIFHCFSSAGEATPSYFHSLGYLKLLHCGLSYKTL